MTISIIIPFYNNEGSVSELFSRLREMMKHEIFNGHVFDFVLVDDGSIDNTYNALVEESNNADNPAMQIVKLTRNFGSYSAFLAGMNHAKGQCCVHLHADLQDPPELIVDLFENYQKGFKLVIANRATREDANTFSSIYHWLVRKFAIKNTPKGGFDLMLFDQQINKEIVAISEKDTNNVYLINWLGYPYVSIPYNREKRKHGKSQWFFWKKVRLFIDTFFSFSNIPINIVRTLFCLTGIYFVVAALLLIFCRDLPHIMIIFISALILFFMSINFVIISEYLIRIHETVRKRPNFVVDKIVEKK